MLVISLHQVGSGRWGLARIVLCLRIACFAAAVPVLGRLSLPRLQSLLGKRPGGREPDAATVGEIVRCVDAVLRRGAPLIRPTCLTRGLILYHFLRRGGLDVTLCFGAGRWNGELAAHCWLVHRGQPFLESRDPRELYAEIYRLPSDGRSRGDRSA